MNLCLSTLSVNAKATQDPLALTFADVERLGGTWVEVSVDVMP